jgi:predicted AlkP superfamily pyrophosphatase or phosphodiesterase
MMQSILNMQLPMTPYSLVFQRLFRRVMQIRQFIFIVALITLGLVAGVIESNAGDKPKLIVVLSYDQLRGDRIARFKDELSDRGFLRAINEGLYFSKCTFNHANTMTGPGHAVLMTGTNPAKHGIVSNEFIERYSNTLVKCVDDSATGKSPRRMKVPTLGDLLIMANPRSKVFGISIKDRASIMMTGQKANCALWLEKKAGGLATSRYYKTPFWLEEFNRKNPVSKYERTEWNALKPLPVIPKPNELREQIEKAAKEGKQPPLPPRPTELQMISMRDNAMWEGDFPGGGKAFPHKIPDYASDDFWEAFVKTPQSIEYLFTAAKTCMEKERLGDDASTDILCVGISTTDEVGHLFGSDSREMKEIVISADLILGQFIDYLDSKIGREDYVLVLTADHGVAEIPEYMTTHAKDAGRIQEKDIVKTVNDLFIGGPLQMVAPDSKSMEEATEIVEHIEPPSIFLNRERIKKAGMNFNTVRDSAVARLERMTGIGIVISTQDIIANKKPESMSDDIFTCIRNACYPPRTGDIMFYPSENWLIGSKTTTHGTPYLYDRSVPLIMMGNGILPRVDSEPSSPTLIAPTLAKLLGIQMKNVDDTAVELNP